MAPVRYVPLNNEDTDGGPFELDMQATTPREDLRQHASHGDNLPDSPEAETPQPPTTAIPVIDLTPVDDVSTPPTHSDTPINASATGVETNNDIGVAVSRAKTSASLDTLDTTYYPRQRGMVEDDAMRRPSMEDLVRYSFSPATHHPRYSMSAKSSISTIRDGKNGTDTTRVYSFWRQTRRLWRLAAGEWLITAVLCASFAAVLSSFSRKIVLTSGQNLGLNSLTTMLTFLLGVNLSSSMRSYAKLLRWILLSRCWQPLETFDLTLRCESFANVCKLAWAARKHKSARLKWMTIALSTLWLLATLALTLFVGMIGLTSSIIPSDEYSNVRPGKVLIRDWSLLNTGDFQGDLGRIQGWGEQGIGFNCSTSGLITPACVTEKNGTVSHKLGAWNPKDLSIGLWSDYTIFSDTKCAEYPVLSGASGTSSEIVIEDYDGHNSTISLSSYSDYLPKEGGFVAFSQICDDCDVERYVYLNVFLASSPWVSKAQYFQCSNFVDMVWVLDEKKMVYHIASDEYQFSNYTARMLAGAIGWTGDVFYSNSTIWQTKTYKNFSTVTDALRKSYGNGSLTPQNMSDFISSYTIRVVAAQDTNEGNLTKQVTGMIPLRASKLEVDWLYAILLLTGIPALQLVACIVVFAVANRAIIKDDSPLSMAKLYWSLLDKHGLGSKACMLKGDELVKLIGESTEEPMGPMVTYGWKDSGRRDEQSRRIGHLDVYEKTDENAGSINPDGTQGRPPSKVEDIFWGGIKYDGTSAGVNPASQDVMRRRQGRPAPCCCHEQHE